MQKSYSRSASCKCRKTKKSAPDSHPRRNTQWSWVEHLGRQKKEQEKKKRVSLNWARANSGEKPMCSSFIESAVQKSSLVSYGCYWCISQLHLPKLQRPWQRPHPPAVSKLTFFWKMQVLSCSWFHIRCKLAALCLLTLTIYLGFRNKNLPSPEGIFMPYF